MTVLDLILELAKHDLSAEVALFSRDPNHYCTLDSVLHTPDTFEGRKVAFLSRRDERLELDP